MKIIRRSFQVVYTMRVAAKKDWLWPVQKRNQSLQTEVRKRV